MISQRKDDEEIDLDVGEVFVITRERAREIRHELEQDKNESELKRQ